MSFALTLALCMIAALWPAITTGLGEPLNLLQSRPHGHVAACRRHRFSTGNLGNLLPIGH